MKKLNQNYKDVKDYFYLSIAYNPFVGEASIALSVENEPA